MKNKKKSAFTLSECLVAMALIGAIATLTLPTIGTSVQQRARLSEFRAAYAKLETALQNIQFNKGRVYNCYGVLSLSKWREKNGTTRPPMTSQNSECELFTHDFVRALGATRFCEDTSPEDGGCVPQNYPSSGDYTYGSGNGGYVLDNGMIIVTASKSNGMRKFAVDINGRKAPNRWGMDIFPFEVDLTEVSTFVSTQIPSSTGGPPVMGPPTPVPVAVGIMSADCADCSGASGKTTEQMLKDSTNYNN